MLKALAVTVAVAGILALSAGASSGAVRGMRTTVTGEISAVGTVRVAIGRFACAIPSKEAASVGRFVIGDPIRLTCLNGVVQGATYAPETAPGQSNSVHPATLPATAAPGTAHAPSSADLASDNHAAYSFSTLYLAPQTFTVLTASGTITAFSSGGITVGSLSCGLPALAIDHPDLLAGVRIGDAASITCRGDTDVLTVLKGSR